METKENIVTDIKTYYVGSKIRQINIKNQKSRSLRNLNVIYKIHKVQLRFCLSYVL